MSRGRTGRIVAPQVPSLRAAWPSWRMPFPTLPTISGKRPASRHQRRVWLATLRERRYDKCLREVTRHMMTTDERIRSASTEEQRRIFEEGL